MNHIYTTADGQKVRVLGNNVLVRPDKQPKESKGGIIIPDNVIDGLHITGEVLALGFLTGARAEAYTPIPDLKVGDRVLYVRFLERTDSNGQMQRVLGDDLIRIRPADILLVLDSEDLNRLR